jgi:hypothetical protein
MCFRDPGMGVPDEIILFAAPVFFLLFHSERRVEGEEMWSKKRGLRSTEREK